MAFTQGQLITATELNNTNNSNSFFYSRYYDGNNQNIMTNCFPSTTGVYSRRGAGHKIGSCDGGYAMWGGATIKLFKLVNGSWTAKATLYDNAAFWGENFSRTVNNSWGEGWYRIGATCAAHFTAGIYAGKTDCVRGDFLTFYDVPTSSGNRISGEPLTVANLNSGRAGTQATI